MDQKNLINEDATLISPREKPKELEIRKNELSLVKRIAQNIRIELRREKKEKMRFYKMTFYMMDMSCYK